VQPNPAGGDASGPNTVRIIEGSALEPYQDEIRALTESTLERVSEALSIRGVTLTVAAEPQRAIGGYGFGGFAPDARTVQISLDPSFPGFAELMQERLPPIVAHELHHTARWSGPGYGSTVLEAMVSEGLADRFSIELLGATVPPWSNAFPREQNDQYLDRARPEFDSSSFDFDDGLFFGADPSLPRWTGYTLGFRLIEAYQAANPSATAAGS
jgi:uncharacterized protein YjaZ